MKWWRYWNSSLRTLIKNLESSCLMCIGPKFRQLQRSKALFMNLSFSKPFIVWKCARLMWALDSKVSGGFNRRLHLLWKWGINQCSSCCCRMFEKLDMSVFRHIRYWTAVKTVSQRFSYTRLRKWVQSQTSCKMWSGVIENPFVKSRAFCVERRHVGLVRSVGRGTKPLYLHAVSSRIAVSEK